MNKSFILISDLLEQQVLEVTQEFMNLYKQDKNKPVTKCTVSKNESSYIIQLENEEDLFLFSYFVNFIKYPIETHLLEQNPTVTGYFKADFARKHFPSKEIEWLQIYNEGTIEEPDSVIITTNKSTHHFFDFGGSLSDCKIALPEFKSAEIDLNQFSKVAEIEVRQDTKTNNSWWKFW